MDEYTASRVEATLYKLVNVLHVEEVTKSPAVMRDLALIKIRAGGETRTQALQICDVFRARVVDVAHETMIIEITGTEDKIDGLLEVLAPFGILEVARTGRVAMRRGSQATTYSPEFVHARVPEDSAV
jgi:acetolactate synthase-1/3 small subunit